MNILGLSYDFHDSAAALVQSGKLVGVAAEERFTHQKHDSTYPKTAISALLHQHSIKPGDIDEVVYYEQPSAKYSRLLTSGLARFPAGMQSFIRANKSWCRDKLWVRAKLSNEFHLPPKRIHLLPHHHTHAAQAFLASPFAEAAILVLDGVGEWDCTTLAVGKRSSTTPVTIVEQFEYPNSIGLVYAAFTAYLGFKPNSGEASTMALAAFGRPRFVEAMREVFGPTADGAYRIERSYFDFEAGPTRLFTSALVEAFGKPRDFRKPYGFDALDGNEGQEIDAEDQRCADIACSLQQVLAEVLLGLAARLRNYTGSANLCVAGGVALNCLVNSRLMQDSGFTGFFIPPDPGDGGASFGAAMLGAAKHGPVEPIAHAYLGMGFASADLDPLFHADPQLSVLLNRQTMGACAARQVERIECRDEELLLERVVEELADGRIVAWVQGCFEIGPRALGNRSLLVDPANLAAIRRMSATVKGHTRFRPYALSIAEEDAMSVIDSQWLSQPVMKWMQTVWPVREQFRESLRGAIHIDGSTRPQVCSATDNPRFWALLRAFGRHSGVSALLNTSLNERGLPIVHHPRMAMAMFARTGIDTLVIDNTLIRKHY